MSGHAPGGRTVEHVACLACGLTCDDIAVTVRGGRIAEARNACARGREWFGDGRLPMEVRSHGEAVPLDHALRDAAALLGTARRALVYLAPDISCDAQRAAVAIADRLRGVVDTASSSAVAAGTLAAQRRGRASATLGEIRNRADLLVFWATDPGDRCPRYATRVAPEPVGAFIPEGRRGRTVVAVDVGDARGPASADLRLALAPGEELDAVAALRAAATGRALGEGARALAERIAPLANVFAGARYAVIVYDPEPGPPAPGGSARRAEALIALAQQLNRTVRCSLGALREGGNVVGAEAVLTWQTGYPMAVDFSRGYPRYRPDDGAAALLERGEVDAVLIVGSPEGASALQLAHVQRVAIGPRASLMTPPAHIAIDTGTAGIHEGGIAYRMDEIPLPLRPPLAGSPLPETAQMVRALHAQLAATLAGAPA